MTMCQVVLICLYPTILYVVITNNLEIGSFKQENICKKGFCEKKYFTKDVHMNLFFFLLKCPHVFTYSRRWQNYLPIDTLNKTIICLGSFTQIIIIINKQKKLQGRKQKSLSQRARVLWMKNISWMVWAAIFAPQATQIGSKR